MASIIYDSCLSDVFSGSIDFESDAFNVMLVTAAYTPNKKTHARRSDVSNEASGIGYDAGGVLVDVSVNSDVVNDRLDVSLGGMELPDSTVSAKGAVYYKAHGTTPEDDELVAYIDFGEIKSSTTGLFSLTDSTLRIQN